VKNQGDPRKRLTKRDYGPDPTTKGEEKRAKIGAMWKAKLQNYLVLRVPPGDGGKLPVGADRDRGSAVYKTSVRKKGVNYA